MKITICYREDHTSVSDECKVYGFTPSAIEPGWIPYAIYELPEAHQLAIELVDALGKFQVEYDDITFDSPVPESANVTAGLVDMILARSEFADIPYKSLTRQWKADYWIETTRRRIPVSEVKTP